MGALFYAISTRTRLSFEAAMHRIGGSVISTENAEAFSDFASSGLFEDTISMVNQYADLIVLRHPEDGLAERAAAVSSISVINAGGGGQHPTQALLDLYTVYRALDGIDGASVLLMGGMVHSGAIRSLCYFLAKYSGIKLWLVSPKELAMGEDIVEYMTRHEVRFQELHGPEPELDQALGTADVVYQTDLPQKFSPGSGGAPRKAYRIGPPMLRLMRQRAIIMHPFPRVDSIAPEVDADPGPTISSRYPTDSSSGWPCSGCCWQGSAVVPRDLKNTPPISLQL